MIYREYLVMRKALAWFTGLLAFLLITQFTMQKGVIRSDYTGIAVTAAWLAAIFASIFGVALGNASRDAARVLWVLPEARWKLALQLIAVDLAGTTVAFVIAFIGVRYSAELRTEPGTPPIAMALAMTYAAYGCSAFAGMIGRRMAYCGIFALPALLMWANIAQSQLALGRVLRAPIILNPFVVFNTGLALRVWERRPLHSDPVTASLLWLGTTWETPVLIAIAVMTCAVAVVLWQRAEAIN